MYIAETQTGSRFCMFHLIGGTVMLGNEDYLSWLIFVDLARTRNVSATAKNLDINASIVSRKVSALESSLGFPLFDRKVRPFGMTADGEHVLVYAAELVHQHNKINEYFRAKQDDDSQIIRVMIGNTFRNFAPRLIHEYSLLFPKLRFNMISPMDVDAFKAGRADIINVSEQHHLQDCVLLPRLDAIFLCVATPSYLKKHGPIEHPSQLIEHNVYSSMYTSRFDFKVEYSFIRDGDMYRFMGREPIRWSNAEMVKEAVLHDYGVAVCFQPEMCIDEIESGKLVPILNGWHRPKLRNYIAVKRTDWRIRNIRTFAQWWTGKIRVWEKDARDRLKKLYGEEFVRLLEDD